MDATADFEKYEKYKAEPLLEEVSPSMAIEEKRPTLQVMMKKRRLRDKVSNGCTVAQNGLFRFYEVAAGGSMGL